MTDWDDDSIAAAFTDWVWVPEGSQVWHVPGGKLVRFPEYIGRRMHAIASPPAGEEGAAWDQVLEHCRAVGETELRWHAPERPESETLLALLRERGGQVEETLDRLAFTGEPPAPEPGDLEVAPVLDETSARALDRIDHEVFDEKPMTEDRLTEMVAECQARWAARSDARYVAWRDGAPLGSGGLSRVEDVLRLWGGATLPQARRQGVYGAVLRARLRRGWEWGATLALVRGRVETSAPILRRTGFRRFGREVSVVLQVRS